MPVAAAGQLDSLRTSPIRLKMSSLVLEPPILNLSDSVRQQKLLDRTSPLRIMLEKENQNRLLEVFYDEMNLGLSDNPRKKSTLMMENTFVPQLPSGHEEGKYMALDLGGTNFRVLLITYKDGKVVDEIVQRYEVDEKHRFCPGNELFDFLASCIKDFIQKYKIEDKYIQMGFCFSFPMYHEALDCGVLYRWTKSFNCPDIVGKDVVKGLNEAMARQLKDMDVKVYVPAILNDTTGTLIQGAYLDHRTAIGLILGTGGNASYIEKVSNIKKFKGETKDEYEIINTEWGSFGDDGGLSFMRTEWDVRTDEQTHHPNSFTFEKYYAGKYLGDIAREVMLTLTDEGLLGKRINDDIKVFSSMVTADVSVIEQDYFDGKTEATKEIMDRLGITCDEEDLKVVQYITATLSYRGALLCALLVSGLLMHMDRPHCTIAIDGSLFAKHPRWRPLMEKLLPELAPGKPFNLVLAKDGSGKGAAMTAAIAERISNGNVKK